MKKAIRFIALCLVVLLGLTGCSSKADYAIKVGDRTVTENDYYRTMSLLRSNYLAADSEAEDTEEYWESAMDNGATLSETVIEVVNDHLIETKLYAVQFDKLALTFTEKEEATIQTALSQAVESVGSMSEFNDYIGKMNYTYEEYLEEVYDSAKKSKILAHYFGEEGEDPVSLQDIKDYYNVHNALIRMVYISKLDGETGEALTGSALSEAKQTYEDAYAAATAPSETDTFDDVISIYSDDTFTQGEGIVVSDDNTTLGQDIVDTIMAMEVGEITKLEVDEAYMIFKRDDGTADDVFTATMQQTTLETIRAEEIDEMLAQWQEETEIKINKKVTKKYAPEKLIEE